MLVPPSGVRPSALRFLETAGVTEVFAIGSAEQLPAAHLRKLGDLGILVERIWDGDAPATALAAAELILAAADGQPPTSGIADDIADSGRPDLPRANGASSRRAVVLADTGHFAESLVATAFAARARFAAALRLGGDAR